MKSREREYAAGTSNRKTGSSQSPKSISKTDNGHIEEEEGRSKIVWRGKIDFRTFERSSEIKYFFLCCDKEVFVFSYKFTPVSTYFIFYVHKIDFLVPVPAKLCYM